MSSLRLQPSRFPVAGGRRPGRHLPPPARAQQRDGKKGKASGANYYDILGVPTSADEKTIKSGYKAMQKLYHPDMSGDEFTELSVDINEAFATLKDPGARAAYDRQLRAENGGRMPGLGAFNNGDGLVGPIRVGRVVMQAKMATEGDRQDEVVEGGQEDALVEWVQEWSKTLVFAAGLPLPLSIQADAIPGGTRLSFIAVNNPGSIQAVAALEFVILPRVPEDNTQANEIEYAVDPLPKWDVQVRRILFGVDPPPSAAATEDRVLKSFAAAVRGTGRKAWGLTGVAAAMTQGLIGGLAVLRNGNVEGSDLEAYHLKRNRKG